MTSDLAILVLAAGPGSRFGGMKLLAPVHGQAMILRSCALASAVAPGAVHVVLGAKSEQLASKLPTGTHVILNPHWQQGLGSSLAAGMAALGDAWAGVLVMLADQVALRAEGLGELVALWRRAPDAIACASYGGQPGVPAIFPRRLFAELTQLDGERGAKAVLLRETAPEHWLAMPEAAVDIDTPAELAAWEQSRP